MEKVLEVEGMTCTGCENTLRRSLKRPDRVILPKAPTPGDLREGVASLLGTDYTARQAT